MIYLTEAKQSRELEEYTVPGFKKVVHFIVTNKITEKYMYMLYTHQNRIDKMFKFE